jgi:hypothetical protein
MPVTIFKDSEVVRILAAQARKERVDSDKAAHTAA